MARKSLILKPGKLLKILNMLHKYLKGREGGRRRIMPGFGLAKY
jgi:hypothetical protein